MIEKLKFFMSTAFTFLLPSIRTLLKEGGVLLARAAMEAVVAVESDMLGVPGTEKRKAAFARITQELKKAGIARAAMEINFAIEAALIKSMSDQSTT